MNGMFRKWAKDDSALIALEVGMLIPVMMTVLLGTVDIGTGIVVSQKVINASQTVGDLLGRNETVSNADLNEAVEAGKLTLMPYDATTYGVDIAGIQFMGGPKLPQIMWRETINMDPNAEILAGSVDLGKDQDGVLGVSVRYIYTPYFSSIFTGNMEVLEVAYVRGRKGLYIPRV